MLWEYSKYLSAIIGIAGGIAILVAALRKESEAANWARKALSLAGLCGVAWGILLLLCQTYSPVMADRTFYLLDHYKAVVGGTGIGILITLFLSGELSFRKWQKHTTKIKATE